MIRNPLTRRLLALTLLVALAVPAIGCGGGGRRRSLGFVQVTNGAASNSAVEDVAIRGNFESFFFNDFINPGESEAYQVPTGNYDVEVFWLAGGSDSFFNVDVFFDDTAFINVSF